MSITVSAVNDAPVLDLDANNSSGATGADYVRTFTEGGLPARVADTDATLTDLDSPTLASVTVTITNLLDGAAEVLARTSVRPESSRPTPAACSRSPAARRSRLPAGAAHGAPTRTRSDAPTAAQRIITVVANDGVSSSNVGTDDG